MSESPPDPLQERRVSHRLLEYWAAIKQSSPYPPIEAISPITLQDIWDDCFVISVEPDGEFHTLTFEYIGHHVMEAYGNALEEEFNSAIVQAYSANILSKALEVLQLKEPVHDQATFTNKQDQLVKYRLSMVPLGNSNGISHVLGGMRWHGAETAIDLR